MSNFSANNNRWLLPEGFEEFLPPQANRIEKLRRELLDLFQSWGYELVIPPLIEYLESLLVGAGNDLELETFKLIDQLSGRLMGVRADMTPQVARIDAHRLDIDAPVRLCYLDAVLRTRQQGFTRTRSPLQIGAELYGHAGIESDFEVLHLMVEMLQTIGLQVHLDLGHVGIFRALARAANLDDQQEDVLFEALQRKDKPEIESYLSTLSIDQASRRNLIALVELNGGTDVLDEARTCFKKADKSVIDALDYLQQIAAVASLRLTEVPLYFDLAELRGYRYQTGVVFAAFVPGHGQEVARGGRYDDIGRVFGRSRPATGFSSDLKTLMALSPPVKYQRDGIAAPADNERDLHGLVRQLRSEGKRVVYILPGQQGDESAMGCNRRIVKEKGEWIVVNC